MHSQVGAHLNGNYIYIQSCSTYATLASVPLLYGIVAQHLMRHDLREELDIVTRVGGRLCQLVQRVENDGFDKVLIIRKHVRWCSGPVGNQKASVAWCETYQEDKVDMLHIRGHGRTDILWDLCLWQGTMVRVVSLAWTHIFGHVAIREMVVVVVVVVVIIRRRRPSPSPLFCHICTPCRLTLHFPFDGMYTRSLGRIQGVDEAPGERGGNRTDDEYPVFKGQDDEAGVDGERALVQVESDGTRVDDGKHGHFVVFLSGMERRECGDDVVDEEMVDGGWMVDWYTIGVISCS
jgi:hypothetical protein